VSGVLADLTEIGHALARARAVLAVADREHTSRELYTALAGVKHEIQTAQAILGGHPKPEEEPCG